MLDKGIDGWKLQREDHVWAEEGRGWQTTKRERGKRSCRVTELENTLSEGKRGFDKEGKYREGKEEGTSAPISRPTASGPTLWIKDINYAECEKRNKSEHLTAKHNFEKCLNQGFLIQHVMLFWYILYVSDSITLRTSWTWTLNKN